MDNLFEKKDKRNYLKMPPKNHYTNSDSVVRVGGVTDLKVLNASMFENKYESQRVTKI